MLCVIVLFGCGTADTDIEYYNITVTETSSVRDEKTAHDIIYDAIYTRSGTCDITSFDLSEDEFMDKYNIWKLIDENPEIDYVAQFSYYTADNIVTELMFEYDEIPSDYHNRLDNSVDFAVTEILGQLMSDYEPTELICTINDYIVTHCSYAFKSDGITPDDGNVYTAYAVLIVGRAVCEGYAGAFTLLAQQFGLEVKKISGTTDPDNVGHAWNMVKIDDFWYHVDTTWNDPTPDKPGAARHNYLLISDEAMGNYRGSSEKYHAQWDADAPKASDSRYDNAFWIYEDVPISFADKHFADYETEIAQTSFADVITYAYDNDSEANVARFGYDLTQLTDEIEQLYPYIGYRYTMNAEGIITKVGDWAG